MTFQTYRNVLISLSRKQRTTFISLIAACVLGAALLAITPTASGQCSPVEAFKLTASDAEAFDEFGYSVAINGNIAIVGAWFNDDAGNNSGSAYLFNVTTGQELFKLTASDAAADDRFGNSVAISDNIAIVGAYWNDDAGSFSGSAYLFDVTTGQELFKLIASDAAVNDQFGNSVAISGNIAIVGAFWHNETGLRSGSAYLFDVTTGLELFKLTASDTVTEDAFGNSVAISGNIAIVGASTHDDPGGQSGAAYLFDVTTGLELFKLTASDTSAGDQFGNSVAISGNTAIVGAWSNNDAGPSSGSAYIFDVTTGLELFKLTASDAAAADRFGNSVTISGNSAIIAAYGNDDVGTGSGSAYLFNVTTGQELSKLIAFDNAAFDRFGNSVAISGNSVIVAAFTHDDGGFGSGSAYLFDVIDPNCCLADITDSTGTGPDGSVDVFDLLELITSWGTNGPGANIASPPNNLVDVFDLLDLLAAWGSCP